MTKKKVTRAGLIPYIYCNINGPKFLFMKPSDSRYGGDKFQIAKGHVDPTDIDEQMAAVREANEELGVSPMDLLDIRKLGVYHGRTHIFLARLKDNFSLQPYCAETGDIKFMTFEEYSLHGRELHLPIVRDALDLIRISKFSIDGI